jgi:hypothetical protein
MGPEFAPKNAASLLIIVFLGAVRTAVKHHSERHAPISIELTYQAGYERSKPVGSHLHNFPCAGATYAT